MNAFDIEVGDRVKSKITGTEGEVKGKFIPPDTDGQDGAVSFMNDESDEVHTEEIKNLEYVSMKEKVYSDEPKSMTCAFAYSGEICQSLVSDGINFTVTVSDVCVTVELLSWPDGCPPELAFIRAKNHAQYWIEEAPYRRAPHNSSDDYSKKKYP